MAFDWGAVAGGGLAAGGSLLGGLFGGSKRTAEQHLTRDVLGYGTSLWGLPHYNDAARAKYGLQNGQQSYPDQARAALANYMKTIGGYADQFESQGMGNVNRYSSGMGSLADMVDQRGQSAGMGLMTSYGADTAGLGRDAKRIEQEARQWGAGRERQINTDYDAYTRQRAGDLLGSMFNRGLGNSTIATAGLAQLGGETERARQASLQNASESANDRVTGAMRYGTDLAASRAAGLPAMYQQMFGMQSAGDPYRMQQVQGDYQNRDSLMTRLLGVRSGAQDQQLGLTSSQDLMYPDFLRLAGAWSGSSQSQGGQNPWGSIGSGLAGIGTSLLGSYFGGGGNGGQQQGGGFYGPYGPY